MNKSNRFLIYIAGIEVIVIIAVVFGFKCGNETIRKASFALSVVITAFNFVIALIKYVIEKK
jgi:hypothetical protein